MGSIENADTWSEYEFPEGVEKVAVVQAKSLHEAVECTRAYKRLGYKKIAYSYGASYYNDVCPHPNKDLGKALANPEVAESLAKAGARDRPGEAGSFDAGTEDNKKRRTVSMYSMLIYLKLNKTSPLIKI